jgi:hypothetical protein
MIYFQGTFPVTSTAGGYVHMEMQGYHYFFLIVDLFIIFWVELMIVGLTQV